MKITLRPSLTLDGFIADVNGECYSWINPKDEERYNEAVKNCGCEIVGRKTYEQYQDDFDSREGIVTYVYTNSSKFSNTKNVKFIGGPIKEALITIEDDGYSEIIVSGGGDLNGLLATEQLINEMHFSVHPVFIYKGIPLFGKYQPEFTLKQVSSNTNVDGVVQTIYEVAY